MELVVASPAKCDNAKGGSGQIPHPHPESGLKGTQVPDLVVRGSTRDLNSNAKSARQIRSIVRGT